MDRNQDILLQELLASFNIEANEHQQAILSGLIEMEKDPPGPELHLMLERTFREIHSLKGAARAVNQGEIVRVCQSMENVFQKAKQGTLKLISLHFDVLYKASDLLGTLISEIDSKDTSIDPMVISLILNRLDELDVFSMDKAQTKSPLPSVSALSVQSIDKDVEYRTEVLDKEEKFSHSGQHADSPNQTHLGKPGSKHTVRVPTARLENLLRQTEEFIPAKETLRYFLRTIKKQKNAELNEIIREMDQFNHGFSRMVEDLLLEIKSAMLYPLSTVMDIVPKIVRDQSKEYNKVVKLTITGGEIAIDRRILEEIKDPLIHIIRNCIDHGIENPETRKLTGKSPEGLLDITVKQETGRFVTITISDDGAGINTQQVLESAIKSGDITRESALKLSDREILLLIFQSGISTSPFVTDISGRGLGMAIVAEKVAKLEGVISVSSTRGQGTTFLLRLPVTNSNFRGILVRENEQLFMIPTSSVEKVTRIDSHCFNDSESGKMVAINDENLTIWSLGALFDLPIKKSNEGNEFPLPLLVLTSGQRKLAVKVEKIIGEMEGMIKEMGPQLIHVKKISGVTILGSGRIVPIVNVPELLDSLTQRPPEFAIREEEQESDIFVKHQKRILVAEDSITMRSLLRNILESAGYIVKTAVDGIEAFQMMKNEPFDLVLSDIEMPKMNGFDLSRQIKDDKTLTETPVILITALDSSEDRKRGMESGANGYIVKGSFEQSDLMEMINRLI
jgi:two-component system, chemotaxis family, sensor kinase CheA